MIKWLILSLFHFSCDYPSLTELMYPTIKLNTKSDIAHHGADRGMNGQHYEPLSSKT